MPNSCLCFFRGEGVISYGEEKHINKIAPKIPGQSRENYVLGLAPVQKCVGDFCCVNFGGFCRGFSWRILLGTFSHKNEEQKSGNLSGADATPPSCRAPGCLFPQFRVCRRGVAAATIHPPPPKKSPDAPHPRHLCGGPRSLDLRNLVALQGVEQLHLRVLRYTLTLSRRQNPRKNPAAHPRKIRSAKNRP